MLPLRMQVEAFKVFRDLADSGSFSKAARSNRITQSAVSQQLRTLERRFGVTLVDRRRKDFTLTPEGTLFYQASLRIVEELDALRDRIAESRNLVAGAIRVSTVYSIGLHELPADLKRFLKRHPGVNVHVEYRRSNQVYDDVLAGTSDLGLVAFPTPRRLLKIVPFRRDRLVAICSPHHPLKNCREVTVAQIAREKFVAFEPDIPTRRAIDRIFRDHGLAVEPVMEFDNIETVKRAVEIDAGIAIVPRGTIEQEVRNGALISLDFKGKPKGEPYYRPLGILHKSGRVLSPAVRRFLETLQEGEESSSPLHL